MEAESWAGQALQSPSGVEIPTWSMSFLAGVVQDLLTGTVSLEHRQTRTTVSIPSSLEEGPSEVGEDSLVGEPASASPRRLEIEGNEHLESSIGGEGGG
jgi:hypothetical protein